MSTEHVVVSKKTNSWFSKDENLPKLYLYRTNRPDEGIQMCIKDPNATALGSTNFSWFTSAKRLWNRYKTHGFIVLVGTIAIGVYAYQARIGAWIQSKQLLHYQSRRPHSR